MKLITWIDAKLITLQKVAIVVLLIAILVLCLLQIVFRYILQISTAWTEELARLGLVWAIFIAASLGVRLRSHTTIELLLKKMPPVGRRITLVVVYLIIAFMGIVMIVYGGMFVKRTAGNDFTSLRFQRNLFFWPVPVAGVLILVYAIREIVVNALGKEELPS